MLLAKSEFTPSAPSQSWRETIFNIVQSSLFEYFIMAIIALNVLLMSMWYDGASDSYLFTLDVINYVFTAIFLIEAILKLIGLGVSQYFRSSWNRFDFVIVVGSLIALGAENAAGDLRVLQLFRALRIFRLVKRFKGMKDMLLTLRLSAPAFINVGCITLLVFFVFAVAGVSLFGELPDREFLTRHADFDNFPIAMLTLFRMATGESWNGVMHDAEFKWGASCPEGGECGSRAAIPFFLAFVVLGQLLMLNLFIAVVLEEFETVTTPTDVQIPLTLEDMSEYADLWTQIVVCPPWWMFWKKPDEWMSWTDFQGLFSRLNGGLGVGGSRDAPLATLQTLEIPLHMRLHPTKVLYQGEIVVREREELCVHYAEGLIALCFHAFRKKIDLKKGTRKGPQRQASFMSKTPSEEDVDEISEFSKFPTSSETYKTLQSQMAHKYKDLAAAQAHRKVQPTSCRLPQVLAVTRVQAIWRGLVARRRIRATLEERQRLLAATEADETGSPKSPNRGSPPDHGGPPPDSSSSGVGSISFHNRATSAVMDTPQLE